jgi:hypothetical protein
MATKMKCFKALYLTDIGDKYFNDTGKFPPADTDNFYMANTYLDISQIYRIKPVERKYFGYTFVRVDLLCADFLSIAYDADKLAKEIEEAVNSDLTYKMN